MQVGLINWSGHNNLGDDAMAKVLLETIPGAVNMGERPTEADWYILGGGTLISPGSLFFGILPDPTRTIGISLGVSCNWRGEHWNELKQMKKIYARDFFSHQRLMEYEINSTLSVDLLTYLQPRKKLKKRKTFANLMYAPASIRADSLKEELDIVKVELSGKRVRYFAMSPDEDIAYFPEARLYTDAQELLDDMRGAKTIYATRLHANVLAWVSGCPNIKSIDYDPKINHFYERVRQLTPVRARALIREHIQEVCELVSLPPQ